MTNFCPEGVRKHPRRTKNFHSPEGQLAEGNKICTLPRDNKACSLKRKENDKSFCHPSVPPSFGYLLSNKINFFSYDHTIFLDGCVELAVRFCTKKRLMICWRKGAAPGCCCWRSAPSWTQRSRKTRKGKTRILEVAT